eukprot:gene6623-12159_t
MTAPLGGHEKRLFSVYSNSGQNTKTSSFAKVNDAFQVCEVSEKVREIWGTGVQPSLWLTLFGKGDKGLRIQAYDAIKEAVSKITSKSHTQFVLNASSCELRSLIREVRDESLSFCRIDWLTKCIIVSSEEQDNQKNEPGSKEDLNLQIDGKQYKSCIDFMANSALRKRDDKANNIFKEGVILTGVILTGVILTGVILTGVILTGVILTRVILTVSVEVDIFAVNVKDSTSDLYSLMKETILKGSKSLQLFETYQLIFWLIECGYRQQVLDIMMKKGYENAFAFVMDKYLTTQNSTKIGSLLKNYRFNLDAYVTKREKDIFDEGKHFNYDLHRKNGDEEMLKNALLLLTDENLNFNRENGRRKRQRGEVCRFAVFGYGGPDIKEAEERQLTNAIRKVSDVLTVDEDVAGVEKSVVCMGNKFNDFSKTRSNYRQLLEDEDDIEECVIFMQQKHGACTLNIQEVPMFVVLTRQCQAPIEADGELPNQCLTSGLSPGAIPWQQRSTRETLHHEAKQMSSLEQMMISRALAIQPDQAFVFWKHEELHPLSNALMMRNLLKGIIDSQIYEEEGIPKKLAESVM